MGGMSQALSLLYNTMYSAVLWMHSKPINTKFSVMEACLSSNVKGHC